MEQAVERAVTGQADDPDYGTAWPAGTTLQKAQLSDGVLSVDLGGVPADRPAGMSSAQAELALDQAVRSAQSAFRSQLPGDLPARRPADAARCSASPTGQPVAAARPTRCSSPVQVDTPADGATVEQPVHGDGSRRRLRGQRPVGADAGRHRGEAGVHHRPRSAAPCRRTPSRSPLPPAATRWSCTTRTPPAGPRARARSRTPSGSPSAVTEEPPGRRRPAVGTGMTTIGLIGAGNIGQAVARLALDHGYDVVLSNSRGPETLTDLVAGLGEHAQADTSEGAADARRPRRGDGAVQGLPGRPGRSRSPARSSSTPTTTTRSATARSPGSTTHDDHVRLAAAGAPAGVAGREGVQPHPVRAPHRARPGRRHRRTAARSRSPATTTRPRPPSRSSSTSSASTSSTSARSRSPGASSPARPATAPGSTPTRCARRWPPAHR